MFVAQIIAALAVLGVCFVTFGALGRLSPCNPGQPVFFSKSIGLDLAYCAFGVVYAWVGPAFAGLMIAAGLLHAAPLGVALASAPLWAQLPALLIATDFCQYWLHRAFHLESLWPYHAAHHSAREVNWTTTFRTHPVNYLVLNTALALLARLIGFSEPALLIVGPIFFFTGALAHANLDWTFGPLRFVIASPVFHRWHHSLAPDARETNYAPTFPIWDLMFGTFRMPMGERPQSFGAAGAPDDLLGQLAYPFAARPTQAASAQP